MSGDTGLNVESKFQTAYSTVLDLIKRIGLNGIKYDPQIEALFSFTNDDLQKMDRHVCLGYAFELNKYIIFLKKEENEIKARVIWAEHNMEILLGKYGHQYGDKFTPFEQRKAMLKTDNEYAVSLNSFLLQAKIKLAGLDSLVMKITNLNKILENLAYAKKDS